MDDRGEDSQGHAGEDKEEQQSSGSSSDEDLVRHVMRGGKGSDCMMASGGLRT